MWNNCFYCSAPGLGGWGSRGGAGGRGGDAGVGGDGASGSNAYGGGIYYAGGQVIETGIVFQGDNFQAVASAASKSNDASGKPGEDGKVNGQARFPRSNLAIGALTVGIIPEQAKWRLAGDETWRASGTTAHNLADDTYTVEFSIVPGWETQNPMNVVIENEKPRTVQVDYSENRTMHPVQAGSGDAAGGSVQGAGEYLHNSWVTLTAMPDSGFRFLHWKDEHGTTYLDTQIQFRATEGRAFRAHFEKLTGALPGVLMLLLDEE